MSIQRATSRKGELRRDLGRHLLAAHVSGRVQVSIGRFSDYHGAGGTNSVLYVLGVKRVLAGKAPQAYMAADQPHTFHYLPDAARGFATLVERDEADGRTWILPAAPPITQHALLSLLADAAGLPRKVGRITPTMLWLIGLVDRDMKEAREVIDQFDRPYTVDASGFEATFGPVELTCHGDAVVQTLASFRTSTAEVTA